jgi:hypothetical protein
MSRASPRSPDQINTSRHCLLTRIECFPARFPFNFIKMIARRRPQVEITSRIIDYLQFSEQSILDFSGYLLAGFIIQIKIP